MQEEAAGNENGYRHILRKTLLSIREWVRPKPADPLYLTILKFIYKGIVLLLMVALSPLILVVLIVIFFATL